MQIIINNKPTELFIVDEKLINHKKVRLLISRVWLTARHGDVITLDQKADYNDEETYAELDQLREEIETLSSQIEENCHSIESDLERFGRIATLIGEMDAIRSDRRVLDDRSPDGRLQTHVPRATLIDRILEAKRAGKATLSETDNRLKILREMEQSIFAVLTDIEIFARQRMNGWPDHSIFDGQAGPAGQAHYLAAIIFRTEYEPSDGGNIGTIQETFNHFVSWQKTRKMGWTMLRIFYDCEALANRADIEPIPFENLFGYIAAMGAAERICVERLGDDIWSEVNDSADVSAGTEKIGFIADFMKQFDAASGGNGTIADSYHDMETGLVASIGNELPDENDASMLYRSAISAAEAFWVAVVKYEREQHTEGLSSEPSAGSPGVEERLNKLKSLLNSGAISELEYNRQRQRVLGEL